jgi:hypothetical protein
MQVWSALQKSVFLNIKHIVEGFEFLFITIHTRITVFICVDNLSTTYHYLSQGKILNRSRTQI